jgi:hypothetical protein
LAGGATEQLPGRARQSRTGRWPHRRAVMVAKRRRRCPQEHGWASQRAAAGRGGPGGADASRAFVTVSASSASVQCPVRASSVHACLSTRPVSTVRCGRLSVQVSGVRCPWVPASAVSDRSEVVEDGGGAGSRMAGMAGVGVVARRVHDRLLVCPGRHLAVEAGAGRAGSSGGVGLDLVVVVGGSPVGRRAGCVARWHYAAWSSWKAQGRVACRCEPPGLDCDLALRPQRGRIMQ